MIARRICSFGAPAFAFAFGPAVAGTAAASEWATATPAEAGFAADLSERLDAVLASDAYDGVHAVVLVRDERLVYERYLTGDDRKWGIAAKSGVVFGPDMLHDVRSISKSVVGLTYGIALAEGKVPGPDAPVLDSFPEYADLAEDPAREAIAVRHALSMTMGTEWSEDLAFSDPRNSEILMDQAPDGVRYALDRPLAAPPGEVWVNNGGATTVLGELIARGAGQDLASYAGEKLLAPLGIEEFEWVTDYYTRPYDAAGLRLRPRDTAKIGQLVLQSGRWDGAQVVPADWIEAATTRQAAAGDCGYGYQWLLCTTAGGVPVIEGARLRGQQILILPGEKLVLVVNTGLEHDPDAWKLAWSLLENEVLPALTAQ